MIRLHVEPSLSAGARVELPADQARYLLTVMRLQTGEAVLLFNGRDGEWRARLAETSKRACVLEVEEQTRAQAGVPDVELVVALVKRAALETIVEKATELGAARVRLVTTRRTNADHTNVARLQAIATEAAEQTERLDVPQILAPEKLERLLDGWDANRQLMFCDEAGDDPQAEWGGAAGRAQPALDALGGNESRSWAILIGPEGGFDPAERARLRELSFVTPVTLGPRILRADTAAISALTLWQAALGDWA
ncbi:16S rRNA (uracil(1498)-N(3))-methyltransferase [Caulobacter sp. 17J80-11]|uniref:16S rRNA (uracil(1498)-N(3))-methyltransferase n=1 Tax=Caulobacter sp. 17J80-11 TaxID=2763502 RepID=UPI001653B2EA|nr:16S rRNA (uracil(1498)-N(3))-methyltransferase [Caulobacter sp. 17J80-11]MBC6982220.1 16S rRNA (uracil(1498)-N(3))-methyltransferase [Caulobacter sp. 17J80-11]